MKRFKYAIATFILLSITIVTAYSQSPGCGNNCKYQPPGCDCPEEGPNKFHVYTGNVHREIRDLEVWGGVGDTSLVWMRYYNSRNGWQVWTHSFAYTMSYEGLDEQGRAQILVTYPEGAGIIFTQSTGNPNVWLPLPGVGARLFQQGNNYFLQTANGYRYRFEKINSIIYGTTYQFQDFRDPYQNLYTLTYDAWHNLLKVSEPAGRFLAVEYAQLHGKLVISKVSSSDGRSVQYNYTLHNDGILDWLLLSSVKYGDGTVATYKYAQSEPGRLMLLEHAIDPRLSGTAVNMRYVYDSNVAEGFIKEERNGVTGSVIITLKTVIDNRWICYPNGRVQHYVMPEEMLGAPKEYIDGLGRTTKWEYEDGGIGFMKSETDALGRVTSYVKSVYGNELEVTHPDGSKEKWIRDDLDLVTSYTDELGRTTVFNRDQLHRIIKVSYPDGTNERFTYNSFGQVVTHTMQNTGVKTNTYDNRGLKIAYQDALNNITSFTYNNADKLASVTNPLGHTIRYEYDERGLLVKMLNPDNSFQKYTYDNFGNLKSYTNEINNTWEMQFDEFKRMARHSDPLNRHTSYSYDLPGGTCGCSHNQSLPTRVTWPSGKVKLIQYDMEWKIQQETLGAGSIDASTTLYEYDAVGNLVTFIDAMGNIRQYEYDLRNRLKKLIEPQGFKTEWTHDFAGNIILQKQADNGIIINVYDNMDRLIQMTDAKGQLSKWAYDSGGNPTMFTDPNGNSYDFEYDLLNRRTKFTYPQGSNESYTYDAAGNIKTYTDRTGTIRTYEYDIRNREIKSAWSDNTSSITRAYDAAGRLETLSNNASLISYAYNKANELVSERQAIVGTGDPRTVNYSYNEDGLRSRLYYPGGIVLSYDYTGRNQLSSITLNDGYLASYAYDKNGNPIAQFRKNAVGTSHTYDEGNNIISLTHQKGGAAFVNYDYGYDAMDRRTFMKKNYGKGDIYAYDAIGQLTGVQYDALNPDAVPSAAIRTVNYDYDAAGNSTTKINDGKLTSYTSNSLNQYTHINGKALTYDENGSLSTFDGWHYIYDAQGRLINAKKDTTVVSFAYDARNRCVKRTINGTPSYLYYDEWMLIEERTYAGLTIEYIHGAGTDDLIAKNSITDGMIFYHRDANGNIVYLTNLLGDVVEQYSYDAFGTVIIKDAEENTIPATAFNNRFLFTGREWIAEIGLYDYRNRVYSPFLGRFLQTDPIRFNSGDFNLYRYVFNDPINKTDPYGLYTEADCNKAVEDAIFACAACAACLAGTGGVGAFLCSLCLHNCARLWLWADHICGQCEDEED